MSVLPTELIGSYALPSWLWIVLERLESMGDLGETDLRETLTDAVRIAIDDQERAGLDVITDGEVGRRDFIQNFYAHLVGLEQLPAARHFGAAGYDQNPRYAVVDKIRAPNGLGIVKEFERLRSMTSRPIKICVPGPMTLALPLILKGGYKRSDELVDDVAAIVSAEMSSLVAAGATYLQIDEPRYVSSGDEPARLVELFNGMRARVEARVGLHLCFGNFKGRSRDRRDYTALFPGLIDARADQFNLEFANREFSQIDLLRHFRSDQRVGIGVIDVKSYFVESPEEVAAGIRLALQYAPIENIVVTPDCGFNHTPRHVALAKIEAMVRGAAIVREAVGAG